MTDVLALYRNGEALPPLAQRTPRDETRNTLLEQSAQAILSDLQEQIAEYEALQTGQVGHFVARDFDELCFVLIKARIAARLSVETLATRIGVEAEQLQAWEEEDHALTPFGVLSAIARATGVRFAPFEVDLAA